MLALGLGLAAFAAPDVARADTATITFEDAAGKDDPVAGVGRTLVIQGNTPTPKHVFVKYRRPGGAACAPAASSDSGSGNFGLSGYSRVYGDDTNGDFRLTRTGSFNAEGAWQFCIWIADRSTTPVTPITQQITFRRPGGTISAVPTPSTITLGQSSTLAITGSTEAPAHVYVKTRPAGGAPCAATASSDEGDSLVRGSDVNGAFSLTSTVEPTAAGAQLICMWLAGSSSDTAPIAGPQSTVLTVVAPPPPCVVPSVAAGTPLAAVTTALTAASCTLGGQSSRFSSRHPVGTLLSVSPRPGTSLATGSPVAVVLSAGRPCTVPGVSRRMTVRRAKAALRANGCGVGRVKRVSSTRRAGRVVRFSATSGSTRAPGSRIGIRVSRG